MARLLTTLTTILASFVFTGTLSSCAVTQPSHSAAGTSASYEAKNSESKSPKRILFVGNSYLYYNDSLHNHVRRIAVEAGPFGPRDYKYKSATIGGARLSHHPLDTLLEPGRLGVKQPFELVILQGGSMEPLTAESRQQFRQSALKMNKAIQASGAKLALYMTHAYVKPERRYEPNQIAKIRSAYESLGNELNALVIPVGLAFERSYRKHPDIKLHKTFDGSHPSLLGTYLAACVVYQSIYGKPANGIRYDYFGAVDQQDAQILQTIADETVREFFERL